jgi:hypothetical protein
MGTFDNLNDYVAVRKRILKAVLMLQSTILKLIL